MEKCGRLDADQGERLKTSEVPAPVDPKAFGARLDALRAELGLKERTKG